ncbi:MAG TPA: hypothetical protein VIH99_02475 [Bdellovibrionota bacterium]|jgi:hypothetical protein
MKLFLSFLLAGTFLLTACARDGGTPPTQDPHLPPSWYQLENETPPEPTSPETDKAVEAAFGIYTDALTEVEPETSSAAPSLIAQNPSDFVPWHLDGLIANFAVGVGGLYGSTILDGAAAVRATWRKTARGLPPPSATRSASGIAFRGSMSEKQVASALEPAIQTALAGKTIRDEKRFRRNANAEGMRFLNTCRALESMPPLRRWRLAAFAFEVGFGASGQITPTWEAGGAVAMTFTWVAPEVARVLNPPTAADRRMHRFVSSMAALIPAAETDARPIREGGFPLNAIEFGLAVGYQREFGLASAAVAANSKLAFIRTDQPGESPSLSPDGTDVPFVGPGPNRIVAKVPAEKFRKGMRQAISMGRYFTERAAKRETPVWRLDTLQTEFAVSVTGLIKMASVSGAASLTLVFGNLSP